MPKHPRQTCYNFGLPPPPPGYHYQLRRDIIKNYPSNSYQIMPFKKFLALNAMNQNAKGGGGGGGNDDDFGGGGGRGGGGDGGGGNGGGGNGGGGKGGGKNDDDSGPVQDDGAGKDSAGRDAGGPSKEKPKQDKRSYGADIAVAVRAVVTVADGVRAYVDDGTGGVSVIEPPLSMRRTVHTLSRPTGYSQPFSSMAAESHRVTATSAKTSS